jgi:cytochrome P450
MPLELLKLEALVMMNAGSETTSSSLCNFTLNMLKFPHIHKKIMATDLSPENLAREKPEFPYLNAVIKETLRWSHPAPALLPRMTPPVGEGVVMPDGRRIPPGTDVNMNIHVVMRDKNIFGQDADEFVPERWLVDSGWGDVKRIEKYNFVWSYGPRVCLGKPLAEMELLMAAKEVS